MLSLSIALSALTVCTSANQLPASAVLPEATVVASPIVAQQEANLVSLGTLIPAAAATPALLLAFGGTLFRRQRPWYSGIQVNNAPLPQDFTYFPQAR